MSHATRIAGALLTILLSGSCTGGSEAVSVGESVPASQVQAQMIVGDHSRSGALRLLAESGRPIGDVGRNAGLRSSGYPAWSPDGKQITFVATAAGQHTDALQPATDLYTLDLAGHTPRQLTTTGDVLYPYWSPDMHWITYTVAKKVNGVFGAGISIVHPDGSGARELTPARAGMFDLAGPYNPVTGRIAFARCRSVPILDGGLEPDTCAVWTMAPDGGDQRMLAAESEQPAWSPDGRRIVFASARDHASRFTVGEDEVSWIRQIYVMNADGSDQHRLFTTSTDDERPSWAPGAAVIAYQTSTRQTYRTTIALVNADGSCRRTLPLPSGPQLNPGYAAPAWRPGGQAAPLICI